MRAASTRRGARCAESRIERVHVGGREREQLRRQRGESKSADENSRKADVNMGAFNTTRAMSRQADRAYMNGCDLFFSDEIVDAFARCFALRLS